MSTIRDTLTIRGLTLRNRLLLPPMATETADGGRVTGEMLEHYRRLTAGGHIGLAVTEHAYVRAEGQATPRQLSAADDKAVEGLARLAEAIHESGTPALLQLNHAGGAARYELTGLVALSPSQIPLERRVVETGMLPKVIHGIEFTWVKDAFVQAALRGQQAGFEGCEIHAAHGYLLNQFYSPLTNFRTDEYGVGTLENRLRFLCEIISAVREAAGDQFIVSVRFGAVDDAEEGSNLKEAPDAALLLEKAGADLLDVSGGMNGFKRPGHSEPGWFRDVTETLKKDESLHAPVVLTGGIGEDDLAAAEAFIEEGKADMIGVGRTLLKNPGWADRI